MRDPGPVTSVSRLALLVLANFGEGALIHLRITPARNERRHPADRMSSPTVAGANEQLRVRAHERNRHRELRAVGEHAVGARAKCLDDAEQVVPAPRVQTSRMIAELIQDLLHLERGEDRFDQHGRANGSVGNTERVLRETEDVVPKTHLEVAFGLRQVEIRPRPASDELLRVVKEVQTEVEQTGRHRSAVDRSVNLLEVPAAGTNDEGRCSLVELVVLSLRRVERQRPTHRVDEVCLSLDHILPRRRECVLEIRHEDFRSRVERVDHHLSIDGSGDLDPPVVEIRRCARHTPLALSHRLGV